MARILVVDDESSMRRILSVILAEAGHHVIEACDGAEARSIAELEQLDIILTDQKMPGLSGLELLGVCRRIDAALPVIFLTAHASVELAVEAMRQGAYDVIAKPFEPETVLAAVARASESVRLARENQLLRGEVSRLESDRALVGESPAMRRVRELIERIAPTESTVLITGETGTGKELVARAIHDLSRRAKRPFIPVNCAAMPDTLLESQLFGHEKGSFTGAEKAQKGLFEAADGGTLFLDEAAEMSVQLQAKLLRVLNDGVIMRVGSTTPRKVDVRIVAATHRNLEERVKADKFREDLYFRLAVVPLEIPPLRDRLDDLPALTKHLLQIVAAELKVHPKSLSQVALDLLEGYTFPGNVRELRNLIERAYILGRSQEIMPVDLPISVPSNATDSPTTNGTPLSFELPLELKTRLEAIERHLLVQALREANGHQAEAARSLGISRSDMAYKVKKYDLRDEVAV